MVADRTDWTGQEKGVWVEIEDMVQWCETIEVLPN